MRHCLNKTISKGFTLLEVLVALSVIAIAMISIIRLQSQTIGMYESVKFYSVAPFLAQEKMTDTLMDPRSYTSGASGDFGGEPAGYLWQVEVSESELKPGDNPGIPVTEVRVKISREESGSMQYTVSRYHPAAQEEQ
ncbi:MAG: prepilin-type N-terminal cleavage/methylation domain-containing protein [Desulfobacterales bacterium]